MFNIDGLKDRSYEPERMDDPAGDRRLLFRTLDQFETINRLVTPNRKLLRRFVLSEIPRGTSATLLDIGAGGGDIARWIVAQSRGMGVHLRVLCIDTDERVAEYCREACRDYPEIETRCTGYEDIADCFDFVFCNHLIHHLSEQQVKIFFDTTFRITKRRLIVSDLRRVWWAAHAFGALAGIMFRDSFARSDGAASIRRAFRRHELAPIVAASAWCTNAHTYELSPARIAVIGEQLQTLNCQ